MATAVNELERVLDLTAQLSSADQLRLIELLVAQVRARQENESATVDMLSLVGVGADLWQQIDVDAYLEQERNSWES
jgi:hypothetical protein